ncbi:carboxypeptidase-like regulatory domain-containing protein [Hymenobacter actinosclerus]|uniref:CarboxypepD_reg-like domain-containing protein n=1 Tax=Hymenobacter actinosclerus TaxID=82805 RepID=A0A1I0ASZ6_9BACT|nr:carboxypeptidase-like regulatory domain-containing protein [Hymenobacter actinosclerus]SES96894.1 CarboxypepD_reg-like domain-containing protein [Hymenobacter actinosclerus]
MPLTTHPFHPATNELLPTHRDAYLRGDLSGKNTELVDAYLKANPKYGDAAFQRFYTMKMEGHQVRPVGWLQQQFELIRTEPARFRKRAGSIALVGLLIGGAVFAGTNLPTENLPTDNLPTEVPTTLDAAVAPVGAEAAVAFTTLRGRILDENGHPLIGATVLDKLNKRGASTDANGNYALLVPANRASELQYGYAGYSEEEVAVRGRVGTHNVTLLPRAKEQAKRRWWLF